jgi:Glutamine phosphoribosylpyrophosphate amidotransferase
MPVKSEYSQAIISRRNKEFIGCDNLVYQDLSDLIDSVTELNSELNDVEKSIFTGVYPTNITDGYLEDLEKKRQAINS